MRNKQCYGLTFLRIAFSMPIRVSILASEKRLLGTLLVTGAMGGFLLFGCRDWKSERFVSVVDTDQNRPAANKTFVFREATTLAPLVKPQTPIRVTLDANGEAHIRLPKGGGWANVEEDMSNSYGTSLKVVDIVRGGRFRLYGSPEIPGDTNLYPSKYLLEVKKP